MMNVVSYEVHFFLSNYRRDYVVDHFAVDRTLVWRVFDWFFAQLDPGGVERDIPATPPDLSPLSTTHKILCDSVFSPLKTPTNNDNSSEIPPPCKNPTFTTIIKTNGGFNDKGKCISVWAIALLIR
jgi:hypothetical protein